MDGSKKLAKNLVELNSKQLTNRRKLKSKNKNNSRKSTHANNVPGNKASGNGILVSCIMPTKGRRHFVSQAIRYFVEQDYAYKELIIVDDGDDLIKDLVPACSNIFYYVIDKKRSIGEKRNFACAKAKGEYIAHWDDDDWHSPRRLSIQIKALQNSNSDICGLSNLYYYCLSTGKAWLYRYHGLAKWIAGGTFLYKKSVWCKFPFSDTSNAEDSIFLNNIVNANILELHQHDIYLGVMHNFNASAKMLDDSRWSEISIEVVSNLLVRHRSYYVQLRNSLISGVSSNNSNSFTCNELATDGIERKTLETLDSAPGLASSERIEVPLVSCIMPTFNRSEYVKQSIKYFLRQRYKNKELIIVDDGDQSVEKIIPINSSIKYIRVSKKLSIGKKRNVACEIAGGDIIMLWDDDDWHSTNRIDEQVTPLLSGEYQASAIGSGFYLAMNLKKPSQFKKINFYDEVVGGTLTFWKELWQYGLRFNDISIGEDTDFQLALKGHGAKIKRIVNNSLFFFVRHGGNTWNFEESKHDIEVISPPSFVPYEDLVFYGVNILKEECKQNTLG